MKQLVVLGQKRIHGDIRTSETFRHALDEGQTLTFTYDGHYNEKGHALAGTILANPIEAHLSSHTTYAP